MAAATEARHWVARALDTMKYESEEEKAKRAAAKEKENVEREGVRIIEGMYDERQNMMKEDHNEATRGERASQSTRKKEEKREISKREVQNV
jgi:hypothetical protein